MSPHRVPYPQQLCQRAAEWPQSTAVCMSRERFCANLRTPLLAPVHRSPLTETLGTARPVLDIPSTVCVHVVALIAEQHDMGVCDAVGTVQMQRKPPPMTSPRLPKVAGIQPVLSPPSQTAPSPAGGSPADRTTDSERFRDPDQVTDHDRICDLSSLHDLTTRLARTDSLDSALHETLRAGATLLGARRGLVALEPGTDPRGAPRSPAPGARVPLVPPVPSAAPTPCPSAPSASASNTRT